MVIGRGSLLPLFGLCCLLSACGTDTAADESGSGASSDTSTTPGDSTTTGAETGDTSNGGECILWEENDCSNPQEKCMPYSLEDDRIPDTNRCCPLDPNPLEVGDPCQIANYDGSCLDDCNNGMMCVLDNEAQLTGLCHPFCNPDDSSSCANDEVCKPFFEMLESAATVPLCMAKCDPLAQDCDAQGRGGWSCLPESLGDPEFLCTPPPPVPKKLYDACVLGNDCEAGLVCVPSETVDGCGPFIFCCSEFCDLSQPDTCTNGNSCLSTGATEPGNENVGICGIPQ